MNDTDHNRLPLCTICSSVSARLGRTHRSGAAPLYPALHRPQPPHFSASRVIISACLMTESARGDHRQGHRRIPSARRSGLTAHTNAAVRSKIERNMKRVYTCVQGTFRTLMGSLDIVADNHTLLQQCSLTVQAEKGESLVSLRVRLHHWLSCVRRCEKCWLTSTCIQPPPLADGWGPAGPGGIYDTITNRTSHKGACIINSKILVSKKRTQMWNSAGRVHSADFHSTWNALNRTLRERRNSPMLTTWDSV